MQISKTVEAQMFNVRTMRHLKSSTWPAVSCCPDSGVDGEVCLEFLELNDVLNSFKVAN